MKPQIVFVLSTNYAGSHFLSLQLASHSRCVSLGEFHRFKRRPDRRRQACAICPDDEQCPVFHGLEGLPLSELFPRVFDNLQTMDANLTTVIDNSKKHDWAEYFLDLDGFDMRYIHLIRDPRALVRRWMLCYEDPAAKKKVKRLMARRCWRQAFEILAGPEDVVYTHKWVYQNRLIKSFLETNGLDARTITYHDLVREPKRILGGLMTWLGHDFEPGQLEYWTFTHHGSQKPQYMKPPKEGTFHDLRWRDFLDEAVLRRTVEHPQVQGLVTDMNLVLTPDGLTAPTPEQDHASPGSGAADKRKTTP